jgi:hypothetical protein
VPQEFLHRHQIYTGHDQVRGESIPQVMEDKALDSGLSKRPMKPLAGAIDVIISLVDPLFLENRHAHFLSYPFPHFARHLWALAPTAVHPSILLRRVTSSFFHLSKWCNIFLYNGLSSN